jgi:HAD superfamily hydrolase (TIGR01484 family)
MEIKAILSDYDGTLCPTTSIGGHSGNAIPFDLEEVLWRISEKMTIVIVTSKDYQFIHYNTMFAWAASCILGLETLILNHKRGQEKHYRPNCVIESTFSLDVEILRRNSHLLSTVANNISRKFRDMRLDYKYTFKRNLLAGVTIDWRHLDDWDEIRKDIEPFTNSEISKCNTSSDSPLYSQTYSTHPFIDVYSTRCTKATAIDRISEETNIKKNILYLGDSENDNPAFRRADVSVGVFSDSRLNPKLDCDYLIDFNLLPLFLRNLYNNEFIFNNNLLP